MEILAQGTADFNRTASFQLTSNAEYVTGAALEVTLPALTAAAGNTGIAWIHSLGHYIFKKIEFKAQSQLLDTQYPEYMDMYSRLRVPASKRKGYNDLIGQMNFYDRNVSYGTLKPALPGLVSPQIAALTQPQFKLLLPLDFWWCQDYTQAIPIGVLLYTNFKIEAQMRAPEECYIQQAAGAPAALTTQPSLVDIKCYVDYVFVDDPARNRIARDSHFYVFKQVQHQGAVTVSASSFQYKLPFVLPVCHLMWGIREVAAIAVNVRRWDMWDRFAGNADRLPQEPFTSVELKVNSQRRLVPRDYLYHARYKPYKHHTAIPESRGIWLFSFALDSEKADANGAANLSRSDNNFLNLTMNNAGTFGVGGAGAGNGDLYVFATNYNYIYIEGGFLTQLYNA